MHQTLDRDTKEESDKSLKDEIQVFKEDLKRLCCNEHVDTCVKMLDRMLKHAHEVLSTSMFLILFLSHIALMP